MPNMKPAARERRLIVRAGLFLALGLLLAGLVIFLIGKERRFFDTQITYHGAFENVDGLKLDAPVRLGGLELGRVSAISFAPDLGDKRVVVQMELSANYAERVRADSVARVTSRGVLGDKAIDISIGSPDAPLVGNGGELETGSSGDISSLLKASGEIIDNSVAITRDLRAAVGAYTSPELRKDVIGFVQSLRTIAQQIEAGDGLLHALVYDKQTTGAFKALVADVAQGARRLDDAVKQIDRMLTDIREGEGTAHALIYDKQVARAVTELGNAASELATLVHDAKQSQNGAVHQLVYGDARGIFSNLGAVAADLKVLTAKIKSGEGSLGAVINDPTVYEDLKEILGNVKRNRVLRELVRYSISNGEDFDKVGKPAAKKGQK